MKNYFFFFSLSGRGCLSGLWRRIGDYRNHPSVLSAVFLASFGIALLNLKRVNVANKPFPASFATSFRSDTEKALVRSFHPCRFD